jgi:hypothetical protein
VLVPYGVATHLSAAAPAGATELAVTESDVFASGATIAVGLRPSPDVKRITRIDAAARRYLLSSPLTRAYAVGARITPDDPTALHEINWVGAVVRHEIAHAVDTAIGGVASFTQGLGGWWTDRDGDDFDAWADAMGNPWQTRDGRAISDADKEAIKRMLVAAKREDAARELSAGLPPDHAIVRYYDLEVPVIEAAKPCIRGGRGYWQSQASAIRKYNGRRFAVSPTYRTFHYYNDVVHTQRVRDYQTFAPAEFFAEVYTVYYEEAGRVPEADLGRKVPVPAWRDWITQHVHRRGHAPTPQSPTSARVGAKSGNPGR